MLAIAVNNFYATSETFVRAHVRTIAPGGTVLLCQDGRGAEALGLPVLSNLDPYPRPRGLSERLRNAVRFRWHTHIDRSLDNLNEMRIREFLLQHGVTHCLAEFGPTGCLLQRAARNANVRLFVHFHGYDATSLPRHATWRRHYTRLFRDAEGVIAPSRFILERLAELGCPHGKLHISSCGIEPQDFVESRRDAGMLLSVGRFVEKKAPLTTIRAFAKVAGVLPAAQLHMVGDGPLFEPARDLVSEMGLAGRIVFHGPRPHDFVQSLLARASIFVQHSVTAPDGDTEGLPVAILEAMASGLPVVSTRHSGITDVVSEGRTGLLVDEHDVQGMGDALIRLLMHPDLAARMGQAGAPRIREEFSHTATANRLRTIMDISDNAASATSRTSA